MQFDRDKIQFASVCLSKLLPQKTQKIDVNEENTLSAKAFSKDG